LYPAAGSVPKSFVQILSLAGVDFTLLGQAEECCGFPLIGCGKWTQAASMVRENVNNIIALGVKRVVTTCPSCFRTIKEGWPGFLESDLPFEVIHASQFLEELVTNSCISFDEQAETVTYHDPCDLGRNSGIYEAPRRVIQSIPGIRLVEMKKNRQDADCCGGGGNLEATDARLSENIALRRIQEAQGTGAGTIISCCQQCKRVLSNAARKNKIKVRVLDLTEFVFKAMKKT
jgi:Fe-S oxidoreductase